MKAAEPIADFPYHDPDLATARFFKDSAREASAITAIGVYVAAAGYSCSDLRNWKPVSGDKLECVCDLHVDDIRLGPMDVEVAFAEGDRVTSVTSSFGELLDLRGRPDA